MTAGLLLLRSLIYYWRTGIVVVLGVAVATAVLVGSLLVGDSVSGSIRDTSLRRLGNIRNVITTRGLFRAELATNAAKSQPAENGVQEIPVTIIRGTIRNPQSEVALPAVNVIGVDDAFWGLYPGTRKPDLGDFQVVLNATLAHDLGVAAGDALQIRVELPGAMPADSLFAQRKADKTLKRLRSTVAAILPVGGVDEFSLSPQTTTPRNVFVSRTWLMSQLGKPDMANTILISQPNQHIAQAKTPPTITDYASFSLEDLGLKIVPNAQQGYVAVESQQMLLNPAQVQAVLDAAQQSGATAKQTSMFIATTVRRLDGDGRSIAYAMLGAVEQARPFTFLSGTAGDMPDADGIWINNWAAQDLGITGGESVELTYLTPSWDGIYQPATITRTVRGVVDLSGSAADPALAPAIAGITDATRIDQWSAPFPVDMKRVTPRDESYWDAYRATPRIFVSMDTAKKLWQSGPEKDRASWITGVRLVPADGDLAKLATALPSAIIAKLTPADAGISYLPVRDQAVTASAGSTDFGQLFLAMGMFLVAAAAGLAAMMMRLMADRRAAQAGIMLATGFSAGATVRTIFWEGLLLTVIGVVVGAPAGVYYAGAIIHALTTWWVGALGGTAALWLHIQPTSIIYGALFGLLIGALSVYWGARDLGRAPALKLLSGWQARAMAPAVKSNAISLYLCLGMTVLAILLLVGTAAGKVPSSTAFFTSGAALLIAGLSAVYLLLTRAVRTTGGTPSFPRLALRSAAANRGRSLLAVGLLAGAAFIIITVAANSRDYSHIDYTRKDTGTGGFAQRALSSLPVNFDFSTETGRKNLGFILKPQEESVFQGAEVIPFMVSPGDDISCLNLAKTVTPRVISVGDSMVKRGGFRITTKEKTANPWELLAKPLPDGSIPVFGDAATVEWTLYSGLDKVYEMPVNGKTVRLRFVGIIHDSIFQSELLVSDANFRTLYPGVSSPRYFLIAPPAGQEETMARVLRENLGEQGLDVENTRTILNKFIAVQNTYISTFLALGGLGVLLGTLGLIIVLLRNALERRREFALLLAIGFRPRDLSKLLLWENAGLLLIGLLIGTIAALVAVAPQLISSDVQVKWSEMSYILGAITAIGLICSATAASIAIRGKLIDALRGE
ncbi:MAG: ABC transporter permease [bacterium]